jgi:hypothetical protein
MSGSLAVAASIVIGFGASAMGSIGTVAELAVKDINKERHPIIRKIGEVFSKTLQNGSASLALIALGSLFVTHPIGVGSLLGVGFVMSLSPTANGLVQLTKYEKLKNVMHVVDQMCSATAKTINTVVLTTAAFMSMGPAVGAVAGISLSALSISTYKKA